MAMCAVFGVMASLLAAPPSRADDAARAQMLVDKAESTFSNFVADPNMTWFRNHVKDARGLLIVPELIKAGFILGGSGGSGVLLERGDAEWSNPAFLNMGSVTFGLQIGAELAEVVLMIMTQKGMDAMYSTEFKLGADASVAAGPVGAGAQAATVDVLAFSRAKGVFGGLTIEGAIMSASEALNQAYYGRPARPVEILNRREVANPGAERLRATVARGADTPRAAAMPASPPAPVAASGADYDLLAIEEGLSARGYDPGAVDGVLTAMTQRAIREYQASKGMPVTGVPSLELQRQLAR